MRSRPEPPTRTAAPPHRRSPLERLRIASVVASALVLLLTGTAWGLYRDITAGITTTDVIAGGGDGGDQNILIVGVDSRTDAQGNPLAPEVLGELNSGAGAGVLNSDTIILLHVPEDPDDGRATAFSIPRDAYVDIPGYRRDKINSAYPATKAMVAERLVADGADRRDVQAESSRAGRAALVQSVERLTGVPVDHYAEINLLGFYNLTTAIGGVDVCLTNPVEDELSGAAFAAGPQTISGGEALSFVRQRYGLPDGDLSRIRRQQVFLAAVADKVLSSGTLTDPTALGALVAVAQRSIVIDEGWDVLAFARQAADIAAGNIEFVTIPTESRESNARGDVLVVDRSAVRDFVEQRTEAAPDPDPAPAPPPPVGAEAGYHIVHVANGSTTSGLAAQVAETLGTAGFARGRVGNTEASDISVVLHNGSRDAARSVAEQLGGLDVASDGSLTRGHVEVVLGADFVPPPQIVPAVQPVQPVRDAPDEPITAAGVPCID